jgi:type IV secretory pathway TrbD component
MVSDATQADVVIFVVLLAVAAIAFGVAVWFGLRVISPRLGRALDRTETEDTSTVDRDD